MTHEAVVQNTGEGESKKKGGLCSVDLDETLRETLLGQECGYLETLIALQLNNLSELFVFDQGAVTRKLLRKEKYESAFLNQMAN